MTVKDLKNKVDFLINIGKGNDIVVVRLKEPSIGGIANSIVTSIHAGFDWDDGKVIIECKDELLSYAKDRDKPMTAVKIIYRKYPEVKPTIHCPICGKKLRKSDRFCSKCGQAISMDNLRVFEM